MNDVLEFSKTSTAPAKLERQKKVWTSEIASKSDGAPVPQHPGRPWRIDAWICLFAIVNALVDEKGKDLCGDQIEVVQEAIKTLMNQSQLSHGLLRFYRVKSFKEDGGDEDKELWIVRFSTTPVGHKLRAAFSLLENLDLLDVLLDSTKEGTDEYAKV